MKIRLALLLTGLKLLFISSYRSTDFEVHRNWLAITSSLPLSQWYKESTSEWTLDYPPFFAWFEWLLGKLAAFVDPAMLLVSKEAYTSEATVLFQRCTVIVTDLALLSAAWYATRKLSKSKGDAIFFLLAANPGLLLVDHIHFQYNGLLLAHRIWRDCGKRGVCVFHHMLLEHNLNVCFYVCYYRLLLWSVVLIREGHDLAGGLVFAVLLNMKHLFACLGPLYFVYLLRHYCRGKWAAAKFCLLGGCVAAIFAASFGPFIARGQLGDVLSRLFPFGRGLTHAYWAANVWALYSCADKTLAAVLPRLGFHVDVPVGHMTGGLVQVSRFAVLPDVGPRTTVILVLASLLPSLVSVWRRPRPATFARAAAYSCLCSFMVGYHVHEKAALLVTVVLALDALDSNRDAGLYMYVSSLAHYALLPLLFTRAEYPLKIAIFSAYTLAAWLILNDARGHATESFSAASTNGQAAQNKGAILPPVERSVLLGVACVEVYGAILHPWLLGEKLPFLPLMLTSVYCATGLVWGWLCLGRTLLPWGLEMADHGTMAEPVAEADCSGAKAQTDNAQVVQGPGSFGKSGRRAGGSEVPRQAGDEAKAGGWAQEQTLNSGTLGRRYKGRERRHS